MKRSLLTLSFFAGLAAWASAQSPSVGPSPAEELKMLKANGTLMEDLLGHGVRVADANTPLDRAEKCRDASASLKRAIEDAGDDPDRIAELAEYLAEIIRDGLAPNLATARDQIHPGSQDYGRMSKIHTEVRQDFALYQQAIPSDGKSGRSSRVKDARQKLSDAGARVPAIKE